MSIATNVAIQINVKLGGEPWGVSIPLNNLMVCGIDTYHDSQVKGRSVAAVVCSLNSACTRYFSKVMFQHNRQELQDGLVASFTGKHLCFFITIIGYAYIVKLNISFIVELIVCYKLR